MENGSGSDLTDDDKNTPPPGEDGQPPPPPPPPPSSESEKSLPAKTLYDGPTVDIHPASYSRAANSGTYAPEDAIDYARVALDEHIEERDSDDSPVAHLSIPYPVNYELYRSDIPPGANPARFVPPPDQPAPAPARGRGVNDILPPPAYNAANLPPAHAGADANNFFPAAPAYGRGFNDVWPAVPAYGRGFNDFRPAPDYGDFMRGRAFGAGNLLPARGGPAPVYDHFLGGHAYGNLPPARGGPAPVYDHFLGGHAYGNLPPARGGLAPAYDHFLGGHPYGNLLPAHGGLAPAYDHYLGGRAYGNLPLARGGPVPENPFMQDPQAAHGGPRPRRWKYFLAAPAYGAIPFYPVPPRGGGANPDAPAHGGGGGPLFPAPPQGGPGPGGPAGTDPGQIIRPHGPIPAARDQNPLFGAGEEQVGNPTNAGADMGNPREPNPGKRRRDDR